jgi:hypothetical protein
MLALSGRGENVGRPGVAVLGGLAADDAAVALRDDPQHVVGAEH